jgi:mannose-1-phosphate guanylyltransferase/mannose-6-phosphate isomerase
MTRPEELHRAVEAAWPLASEGAMVTFGIVADRPETGYGYIQKGDADGNGAFGIQSFAEKPSLEVAEQYLQSGQYLWNSGLFMVRADQWLKAMAALQPAMLQACEQAMAQSSRDMDFIRPHGELFGACPADSIDYAVMEKLPVRPELGVPARVVPLDAGWSDLGAWDALWDVLPRDAQGNAGSGETLAIDTSNSLLFSESRLIAAVGLDNVVVVETADAVLVADKSRTQDVKKVVAELKAQNRSMASAHRKVHRPWGWYDSIDGGNRFQVKRIVVNPGGQLSLQMHHHRAEHWIVVKGTAEVTNGDQTFLLGENESTFIPLGHVHRLANPGKVPLEIIEVQSGSYLGEDDIVRFEDTYGRAPVVQASE